MAYTDDEKRRQFHRDYYAKNPHYAKNNQEKKRQRNRDIIAEHCGCSCCKCGSTENLEYDHINPSLKKTKQSFLSVGKGELLSQIDNIQVLCRSCHKTKSTLQKKAAWQLFTSLSLEEQEKLMDSVCRIN
jgi:5-methylcytosine-specific restriction endonuclease McrA